MYQKWVLHQLNRSLIKQGNYITLTPAQKFKVGKRAAEHSVTATTFECFDKLQISLQIICPGSLLPFSSSPRVAYRLILMVASNHRYY